MKRKYYAIVMIVGLVIGFAQFFYVYDASPKVRELIFDSGPGGISCMAVEPACGDCPGEVDGDYCIWTPYGEADQRRGFPLYSSETGVGLSVEDTNLWANPVLYFNLILWTLGLPLILFLGSTTTKNLKDRKH